MINPQKTKTPVRELEINTRITNNEEVVLGYNAEEALNEANRCLNCPTKPCMAGCPLHNDIPAFINTIKNNNLSEGMNIISKTSPLPFVCSKVCDQAKQCEKNCTRGKAGESVAIGLLERFICENTFKETYDNKEVKAFNGKKVAIIGAGPSGLACAQKLALEGFKVDVFDRLPFIGGLLVYGIPHFRLPKDELNNKIQYLKDLGINFTLNCELGKGIELEDLKKKYNFVYLAIGADNGKSMRIEGEDKDGVVVSNKYLLYMNAPEFYSDKPEYNVYKNAKNVVVSGGGNVAMDSARVALRNGAKVTIVYRRSREEMPARDNEIQDAINEGINVRFLTNPVKVNGENRISSITCVEMELGEPDESGRRRPIVKENSEFDIPCDLLVYAIGSNSDINLLNKLNVDHETWGGVKVNENLLTSSSNVFAGGDLITGANTVVHAVRDGLLVANYIINS